MTPDELRDFLTRRQVQFDQRAVQHGTQFRCRDGEIFMVFDSGKLLVQGKRTALSDAVQGVEGGPSTQAVEYEPGAEPAQVGDDRQV